MRRPGTGMGVVLGVGLAITLVTSGTGRAQESAPPVGAGRFIHSLVGEWVGTCVQSTDGKAAANQYFHAVIKQTGPDTYEALFDYYRLDPKTGAPFKVGGTTMATNVAPNGIATNRIIGKGEVLIDAKTLKPEEHELFEVLHVSPSGGMEGTGRGSIKVSGLPLGLGKNGVVEDYRSTWSQSNGVLRIRQYFKVKFKILFFSKRYTFIADYSARPGKDIVGLIKRGESEANRLGKPPLAKPMPSP